jgi:two-component system, chemotaxis family, sensor kinase Cph1
MDHSQHAHTTDAAVASTSTGGFWDFWSGLFSGAPFMPHKHCYMRQDGLIALHVISDALISAAYYSIPLVLFAFVWKRRDIPFNWIFILFGTFILACGTTHIMEIITVWDPVYRLAGLIKLLTAVVSVTTAILLVPLMPKALALPSLKTANVQLSQAANELRRSNQELEQFAYVASHDLQEPLRMVTMFMDLIRKDLGDSVDKKTSEYLGFASEGAQRMRLLIDDLLAYSRIERSEAKAALTDANEALAEALENLQMKISETGCRIQHAQLPTVFFNHTQLVQLFQNIIGNAVKFSGPGECKIDIAVKRTDKDWVFSIRDSGIGIDPTHHERIFEVFQRLHSRTEYPGTGIGLAVCKKIVDRHAGKIWVESRLGGGSTFFFSVPHQGAA